MPDDNELRANNAALELRPLSTSELIDRGFQLYRRYFVPLFYFSAMLQVVPFALGMAFWRKLEVVGRVAHIDPLSASTQPQFLLELFQLMLWAGVIFVVTAIFLALSEGALTLYVGRLYLGEVVSIGQTVKAVLKDSWSILFSMFVKYFALALAFSPMLLLVVINAFWSRISIASVIILFTAGVVLLIPGLMWTLRYWLTIQAVVFEKRIGWKALKRSSEITRYDEGLGFMNWGETRLSIILLVVVVVNLLVAGVSHIPEIAIGAGEVLRGNAGAAGISVPPVVAMFTNLLNFLGSSVIAPLYVIAGTLFYYDVRVRKEALDLELMAEALQKENDAVAKV